MCTHDRRFPFEVVPGPTRPPGVPGPIWSGGRDHDPRGGSHSRCPKGHRQEARVRVLAHGSFVSGRRPDRYVRVTSALTGRDCDRHRASHNLLAGSTETSTELRRSPWAVPLAHEAARTAAAGMTRATRGARLDGRRGYLEGRARRGSRSGPRPGRRLERVCSAGRLGRTASADTTDVREGRWQSPAGRVGPHGRRRLHSW